MNQGIKNKNVSSATKTVDTLFVSLKPRIPHSWRKAIGLLRSTKQRRELELHVKRIRSEWN